MTAIQTPAADAPAEEWGALAVSIPGWRATEAQAALWWGWLLRRMGPVPDPDHWAWEGWLLRRMGPRCLVRILPREGLPIEIVIPSGMMPDGRPHRVIGINLGRACIAAAAALGRWPGGAS